MDKSDDRQLVSAPVQKPNLFNRVTGPTSGPYAGNVMTILTFALVAAVIIGTGFLMFEVIHNGRSNFTDLMTTAWQGIFSAFTLAVGFYFGARTVERNK